MDFSNSLLCGLAPLRYTFLLFGKACNYLPYRSFWITCVTWPAYYDRE